MPVKLKPSQTVRERGTNKLTTTHFYMKCQSMDTLVSELESCFQTDLEGRQTTKSGKGKLKQKIQNEIVRRKNHLQIVP